ncbi:MAG: hypothetical protein CMJ85_06205, partial [Planctomycetes bacterium]|nr:hypothetical protein [Planctomycetota bacterium]
DEPGWSFPHATELVTWEPPVIERFHAYLREKAMTPVLLGREGWSDVAPIGMPTPEAPLAERRLWYHTVRFSDLEEARTYAVAARAVRAELGEEVLGFVNWNNPGIFHSDLRPWRDYAVYCSSDWFTFSRARGNTCLWLGPGVSEGGYGYQSTFRMWSMALNLLRSAADQGVGRFGAYVHHNFIPDERGYEVALSIMAVAGHGGSGYESYVWGPRYAFTEYMWSEKFGHYAPVADANRLIGRSEYLMVNAEAPKAEVALLWPITSQLYDLNMRGYWTYNRDYLVEMEHVWFALNHQNIPVAFVDETMVQQGELAKYRLLYVTGPNVERKTAETIAGWVSEGGHLWSSAAPERRDEHNESMDVLDVVLGVAARSVHKEPGDYSPKVGLRNMKPLGTIVMRDAPVLGKDPWQAYGSRERFTVAPGAVVAGTFDDDGSAAVVRNEYGKGSSFHFAAMPGLAYSRGTTEVDGRPTIDYPEHIARLVAAPARALNVRRPARSSLRHVETAVLESEAGMAVTLLNWSGKPVKELEVTLRGIGGKVKRLSSARLGALPHETHGDHVVVTLSMPEVIDVMLIEFE